MAIEQLGYVECNSGVLAIVDFGLAGTWAEDSDAPRRAIRESFAAQRYAFSIEGVDGVAVPYIPAGSRLPVFGVRIDGGEFEGLWQAVYVDIVPQPRAARTVDAGRVLVDEARIGIFDAEALAHWKHDQPMDGRADVAFWGLHGAEVARRFGAPKLPGEDDEGTCGWKDLPDAEAQNRSHALDELRNGGQYRFAWDYRPHSHHYHLLAQMRASPTESGVLRVGNTTACGFFTSWGDGEFPVMMDFDEAGALQRVGVFFATPEAQQNMRDVNE